MYSTKTMFPEQNFAHQAGGKPSYAPGLGGQYRDPGKVGIPAAWKGKQFGVGKDQSKRFQPNRAFTDFTSLFLGEPYDNPALMKKNQPVMTGYGFGSKDPPKRGEFSDTKAVLQYREKMKTEQTFAAKFARDNAARLLKEKQAEAEAVGGSGEGDTLDDLQAALEAKKKAKAGKTLFDTVFNNNDEAIYDTLTRPRKNTRQMNMGPYKTTAYLIGGNVDDADYNAKRFGNKNCTKDFFDHGHRDPMG
jgi:hypothetical protein